MPENSVYNSIANSSSSGSLKKQCTTIDVNWFRLPYELWLTVLVRYGVSAADLVCLEYTAKWFSNGWGGEGTVILKFPPTTRQLTNLNACVLCVGGSVTEEAARLIVKNYKRRFFGDLVNRVAGASWKEKLYSLEKIGARLPTTATGSYQNITLIQG